MLIAAKLTVFSPIATLETVQSLSGFGTGVADSSHSVLLHGTRLAYQLPRDVSCVRGQTDDADGRVDMRLFRCLGYLYSTRNDPHRTNEKQRALVAGARVWLAVSPTRFTLADT